jgi:hypothetical protein
MFVCYCLTARPHYLLSSEMARLPLKRADISRVRVCKPLGTILPIGTGQRTRLYQFWQCHLVLPTGIQRYSVDAALHSIWNPRQQKSEKSDVSWIISSGIATATSTGTITNSSQGLRQRVLVPTGGGGTTPPLPLHPPPPTAARHCHRAAAHRVAKVAASSMINTAVNLIQYKRVSCDRGK